ncbi:MAG: anti-sigma factor domain-containing protein [Motilibacteraceae bacterium]
MERHEAEKHCDPELLALRALGEPIDAESAEHLATCPACAADLASLTAVVAAGRGLGDQLHLAAPSTPPGSPAGPLVAPPPAVWDRIAAEVGLDEQTRQAARDPLPAGAPAGIAPVPDLPRPAADVDDEPSVGAAEPQPGPGDELAFRRSARSGRRWLLPAAVAAAVGIVVGAGAATVVGRDPAPQQVSAQPVTTVLGRASLVALPGHAGSGEAIMEQVGGQRRLVVDVDGLRQQGGYLEVWLMDPGNGGLVSLGVLAGGGAALHGDYPVPATLDLAAYPAVDVSAEPFDGNPAHSADSIVRGTMGI